MPRASDSTKILISQPGKALSGSARPPGDKSISHRALMIAGLSVGRSRIKGLLQSEDVMRTADAIRALGCQVNQDGPDAWSVYGRGVGGLAEPDNVLDMGNSGTGARLLMGVLAGHHFTSFLSGDSSLRERPMQRIMTPLSEAGARFVSREGGRLPLAVIGADRPMPISYRLPMASAQVKSAILLCGLHAPGTTTVIEPTPSRDHTERMLRHFGAEIRIEDLDDGAREVSLAGQPELTAQSVSVPADFSSAAFPLVAALLVAGSEVTLQGVGLSPLRSGLLTCLGEMGADLDIINERSEGGEPVADLRARASSLQGIDVPADRAPAMIDEYPILAIAAACAKGTTRMSGLAELRVKESDRVAAMTRGLAACGVEVEEGPDWLTVQGLAGKKPNGATIDAALDHRIAMSFAVLGLLAKEPIRIADARSIDTSFPGFVSLMNGLGASLKEETSPS